VRGAQAYLDTKRAVWPRLFLLRDADLLAVLAATDPHQIDHILPALFGGVLRVPDL
jgi:hypothetical protein